MYGADEPLWQRYEQACDFLEDDIDSGYVRVLQEMIAAGWSTPAIAEKVRAMQQGWFDLLTDVADRSGRASSAGSDRSSPAKSPRSSASRSSAARPRCSSASTASACRYAPRSAASAN